MTESAIAKIIGDEMNMANDRFGPFTSAHEALGVLTEEMRELEDAIRMNALESVRLEAMQVAAVAWRLAISLNCDATVERSGMGS
jgi:NTP pyrophosphatase (non-canonical NTP hydrolase)